jgi:hypothetical protein
MVEKAKCRSSVRVGDSTGWRLRLEPNDKTLCLPPCPRKLRHSFPSHRCNLSRVIQTNRRLSRILTAYLLPTKPTSTCDLLISRDFLSVDLRCAPRLDVRVQITLNTRSRPVPLPNSSDPQDLQLITYTLCESAGTLLRSPLSTPLPLPPSKPSLVQLSCIPP